MLRLFTGLLLGPDDYKVVNQFSKFQWSFWGQGESRRSPSPNPTFRLGFKPNRQTPRGFSANSQTGGSCFHLRGLGGVRPETWANTFKARGSWAAAAASTSMGACTGGHGHTHTTTSQLGRPSRKCFRPSGPAGQGCSPPSTASSLHQGRPAP